MKQTGHWSVQMVRRYIRDGSLFRENSAGKLGLWLPSRNPITEGSMMRRLETLGQAFHGLALTRKASSLKSRPIKSPPLPGCNLRR